MISTFLSQHLDFSATFDKIDLEILLESLMVCPACGYCGSGLIKLQDSSVCVCVTERENVCVCERDSVYMCVCVCERERESVCMCACMCERVCVL